MRPSPLLTACLSALPLLLVPAWAQGAPVVPLDTLDLTHIEQDYGSPHANRSIDDHPLTLGGKVFEHGIGTHANSHFAIDLKGSATKFMAK